MNLSRTPARLSWTAAGLLLVAAVLGYQASLTSGTLPPLALAMLALIGALIGAICALHATLIRLAAEEAREHGDRPSDPAALFQRDGEGEGEVKARNLHQFERLVLPGLTGVLALGELLLGMVCWRLIDAERILMRDQLVLTAVLLFVVSLVLYLLGSYLAGLAFSDKAPALRAIAGESVGLAYLGGLAGAAELIMLTDFTAAGAWFAMAVAAFLVIRALEKVINIVLEIYRPRHRRTGGYPHESRLNGLVAQPRNMMANLADTLNYQFGLQLTEQQMRRLGWQVLPFLALQVVILLAFSSLLVVTPGQQALIERFGRPQAGAALEPGLHFKLPWPIDRVHRIDVETTRSITLGTEVPLNPETETVLWSNLEIEPGQLLVVANRDSANDWAVPEGDRPRAVSFNLMGVSAVVRYRVADAKEFIYSAMDAEEVLERLARRQITHYLAGNDLLATLEGGQQVGGQDATSQINAVLRDAVSEAAGQQTLGVEVLAVSLVYVQPPPQVVQAFQSIIAAGDERQRLILTSRTEALTTAAAVWQESLRIQSEAYGYAVLRTNLAEADRTSFVDRQAVYANYPEIYRAREYFSILRRAMANRKKIIIATDVETKTTILELKEQPGTQLFDMQP